MFGKILVPVDLHRETSWRRALPVAADQARLYGAKVILLYMEPGSFPLEAEPHEDDERVAKLRGLAGEHFDAATEVEVRVKHHNSVHRCIQEVAADEGVDLIVMNSHDPTLRGSPLGSAAAEIAQHAACSVLMIR